MNIQPKGRGGATWEHKLRDWYVLPCCRYQSNMAKEVLDSIMNIQPKDSGGGGGATRESVVYSLADDMLEKLPPDYLPHEVRLNEL